MHYLCIYWASLNRDLYRNFEKCIVGVSLRIDNRSQLSCHLKEKCQNIHDDGYCKVAE